MRWAPPGLRFLAECGKARRPGGWALGSGLLLVGQPARALACASCASSAFGDQTFNWAFVALMAAPFAVGGVVGGIIFHAYRRRHEPGG